MLPSQEIHPENHENWKKVELTAGRKIEAEVKIMEGIFLGDAHSPLLFVIAFMPFTNILKKCAGGDSS